MSQPRTCPFDLRLCEFFHHITASIEYWFKQDFPILLFIVEEVFLFFIPDFTNVCANKAICETVVKEGAVRLYIEDLRSTLQIIYGAHVIW